MYSVQVPFTKRAVDIAMPADAANDFPVAMQAYTHTHTHTLTHTHTHTLTHTHTHTRRK
jgi:carbohydrate-binding DOMON domain-containing protein